MCIIVPGLLCGWSGGSTAQCLNELRCVGQPLHGTVSLDEASEAAVAALDIAESQRVRLEVERFVSHDWLMRLTLLEVVERWKSGGRV